MTENFVGWRKSSYSGTQSNCVEVGRGLGPMRKSSYSGPNNNCVEVGRACDRVGIRDTKNREAGHLAVPVSRFLDFIGAVKDGAFER